MQTTFDTELSATLDDVLASLAADTTGLDVETQLETVSMATGW